LISGIYSYHEAFKEKEEQASEWQGSQSNQGKS